jgi:sarcosine oxidase/L-pipecolate oxidase
VREIVPQLTGRLPGWSGYFNSHAGWASAAPALGALHTELLGRAVKFRLGVEGSAEAVLPDVETAKTFPAARPYVRTADQKLHCADVVIIALGAHTARLLPSVGAQLSAKSWAVAHVRVSAEEAARLKGLPVVNCRDLGFFFEPVLVREDGRDDEWEIKLCAHGGGYTNKLDRSTSLAPFLASENDGIPVSNESLIRRLLETALPEFASRPLKRRFMCWCADTADSEYVIDFVPGYNGLVFAGGDSGHAFKMIPVFGEWVADVLETGSQELQRWRWKERSSDGKEDIDWRVGSVKEISGVERRANGYEEAMKSKL